MIERHEVPTDVGLLRRALARAVDAAFVVATANSAITTLVADATTMADTLRLLRIGGAFDAERLLAHVTVAALAVAYFAVLEAWFGRTPGKLLVRIRVIGSDGGAPRFRSALGRNAWLALPVLPWLGTLATAFTAVMIALTITSSATNTGWHDELADTAVVRTA